MIKDAVYFLEKTKRRKTILGWDKVQLIERRPLKAVIKESQESIFLDYEWVILVCSNKNDYTGYEIMGEDELVEDLTSNYKLMNPQWDGAAFETENYAHHPLDDIPF